MIETHFQPAFFGNLGTTELLVILFIVMILFGVGKLPQVGGALGRAIRNFKDSAAGKPDSETKPDPAGPAKK